MSASSTWDLTSERRKKETTDKTNPVNDSVELPKANSTLVDSDVIDSAYATKENETLEPAMDENTSVKEIRNAGHRNLGVNGTVLERRQPKLTEKGRAYRLDEKKGQRKKLEREMKSKMAIIIFYGTGLEHRIGGQRKSQIERIV